MFGELGRNIENGGYIYKLTNGYGLAIINENET